MEETAETNFDEFKRKDSVFVADWLKTKGLHKLCFAFEDDDGVWAGHSLSSLAFFPTRPYRQTEVR